MGLLLFESFIKKGWEKALYVTGSFRISPIMTFGPSMLPTIDSKPCIFLAERITIRFGKVARGDIVVVRSPENPRKVVTKRIVGMEGDTVTYLANPKYSAKRKTVVTTYIIPVIRDILVRFLMAILRVGYSGSFRQLKILDLSGKDDLKLSIMTNAPLVAFLSCRTPS